MGDSEISVNYNWADKLATWAFRRAFNKRGEKDIATLPRPVAALREKAREFADREIRPRAMEFDAKSPEEFDWEIVRIGAREGWLGLVVPSYFGGSFKLSHMRYGMLPVAVVIEEFARACSGIGLIFGAHGLGLAPITFSFNLNYMKKYFPPLMETIYDERPKLAAFAITEPAAGSDAENAPGAERGKFCSFANRVKGGWKLNGRKCFISNGGQASLVTVFASIDKADGHRAWTCFVVNSESDGYSVGRLEDKMGQRAASAAELIFEDVFVPDDDVIYPLKSGWELNTFTLDASRGPVAAIAVGIGQGAYDAAFDYCMKTRRGGRPLIEHGWVRQEMAEMAAKLEAARGLCHRACTTFPASGKISAMAKSFCADVATDVCMRCVQVLGPEGLERDNRVEKYLRDAKLTQIYEGTNQINRLKIMEDLELEHKSGLPVLTG